jgi:hypothetical protein
MGQVRLSAEKKKTLNTGVEKELMKCRFMRWDGKNLSLLSFHFGKKGGLADASIYIVEREREREREISFYFNFL